MFSTVGNIQPEFGTSSFLRNGGVVFQKTMSEQRLEGSRYSRRRIGQKCQQILRSYVERSGTSCQHGISSTNPEDRLGPAALVSRGDVRMGVGGSLLTPIGCLLPSAVAMALFWKCVAPDVGGQRLAPWDFGVLDLPPLIFHRFIS